MGEQIMAGGTRGNQEGPSPLGYLFHKLFIYYSRGHPGLKLCVHVSAKGYYRFTNFCRNQRGLGSKWHFLDDFTWNDPYEDLLTKISGQIFATENLK